MIFAAGRILELSIAAQVDNWLHEERLAEIAGAPDSRRQRIAAVLLNFADRYPSAAAAALNGIASFRGLQYLGTGVDYTVYRRRALNDVIKVHRNSAEMTPVERDNTVCEKRADHTLLRNYLGSTVVSQTVKVGQHVLGDYGVVLVRQPFVPFGSNDNIFEVNQPRIKVEKLDKIARAHPAAIDGLQDFVHGSLRMLEQRDCLPDTNGKYNVVTAVDGSPVLIDTSPIPTTLERTAELILDQLHSLETGLKEVA